MEGGGFMSYVPEFLRMCTDSGAFAMHGSFGDTYNIYDWYCHSPQETREMVSEAIAGAMKEDCGSYKPWQIPMKKNRISQAWVL